MLPLALAENRLRLAREAEAEQGGVGGKDRRFAASDRMGLVDVEGDIDAGEAIVVVLDRIARHMDFLTRVNPTTIVPPPSASTARANAALSEPRSLSEDGRTISRWGKARFIRLAFRTWIPPSAENREASANRPPASPAHPAAQAGGFGPAADCEAEMSFGGGPLWRYRPQIALGYLARAAASPSGEPKTSGRSSYRETPVMELTVNSYCCIKKATTISSLTTHLILRQPIMIVAELEHMPNCVSLVKSDYIWREYGNKEGSKGKVCVVFKLGKQRKLLNQTMQNANDNAGLVISK